MTTSIVDIYNSILLSVTQDIMSNFTKPIGETEMLTLVENYFTRVLDAKAQESVADDMASLRFDNVGDFELIENYHSIQVLVESDEEARSLRVQIEENMIGLNKFNTIPKLKVSLNNNIITIWKPKEIDIAETLPMINGTEIRYIPMNELDNWYNAETGISLQVDRSIERRII